MPRAGLPAPRRAPLANPLKFIDELRSKGDGYGWVVRLPVAPGKELRQQFLSRDYGGHREALQQALQWRDETCRAMPFPIHARVGQYLDGTHKAIQHRQVAGKPLTLRAQWVEFDADLGRNRVVDINRVVRRPEDYDAVYAELDAIARPRIVREAERIAKLVELEQLQAAFDGTPVPEVLVPVVARCQAMFTSFQGQSLEQLRDVLMVALEELAELRKASARDLIGSTLRPAGRVRRRA